MRFALDAGSANAESNAMTRASISAPILSIQCGPFRTVPHFCAMLLLVAAAVPVAPSQTVLPGTRLFTYEGDPAANMVDAINAFLTRETAAAADRRFKLSKGDVAP